MEDSADAPDEVRQQHASFNPLEAHLMRRAKFFENEALMLAINLRDVLDAHVPPAKPRKT